MGCEGCQHRQQTWSDMVATAIEQIKKDSLKECKGDRLCIAKKLVRLLITLSQNLKGWQTWMNFEKMDNLTKKEMEELYLALQKVIIEFLQIDYDITKKKEDEAVKALEAAVKKAKKAARKKGNSKKKYIA